MYDVAIIGCGVIGAASAYALSRYRLNIAVIEASNDVSNVTSKANSAILHAGYDPEPGTLMASLNVRGVELAKEICRKLDVEYYQIGSLVLAFSPEDEALIQTLFKRGTENGVPGLRILNREETLAIEPNLSESVVSSLLAPSAAIVNPWEFATAMAETAVSNGASLKLSSPVLSIDKEKDGFVIHTSKETLKTRYIINAAGANADKVHEMVGGSGFSIIPNRGEYYLMDKSEGDIVKHVVFQCPGPLGKGVLVSPTVHGNLIVGPNAQNVTGPLDTSNTSEGLSYVRSMAVKSVPSLDFRRSIRNFAGVRANSDRNDFVIEESSAAKGFINLSCIKSPGLSASPAIGEMAVELLRAAGLETVEKENFIDERHVVRFNELSEDERRELINKNPLYGRIICRCESVTEGEIVDALHRSIVPTTIGAVKRRTSAGMGRCQGGFCGPRVHEIISRELGIPMEQILMDEEGSYILTHPTKEASL